MLPSTDIVKVLQQSLKSFRFEAALVVDPVMVSTSGDVLAGPSIVSGFRNVLVKGGDLPDPSDAVDIFFDGENFHELRSSRIKTRILMLEPQRFILQSLSILNNVPNAVCVSQIKDIVIGNGPQGPFDHLLKLKSTSRKSCRQEAFDPSDLFLYAVTDPGMNKKWGRSITDAVKAAIEGGATIVQLREKDADTGDFLEAAKACTEICHLHGVPLLINDRVDVALACDADGIHIGQSDMPVRVARVILGPEKIIGKQSHCWVGWIKNCLFGFEITVVAIGGIGISNASDVMKIGVPNLKGVAVVSALFDRECVLTETKKLHAVLTE
ncbi:hypothetical protein JRO89_XS02G0216600 [Xanthoceras sorbifolium]|uniref:Thiamine phosphate synthase/TenI domain-containing protein n=1 Tax=Xanthoceras sorbifolium TaxID=99658 RepID=A0ABQ8IGM6_9ROSI|nr:hypothetical protein JRO89_XS02G0216600 [Xanthoceras sorbifolium]